MFDLAATGTSTERFDVEVPGLDENWEIGLITGPSGSGKTAVARRAFGAIAAPPPWPADQAVVDGFDDHSIRDITRALTGVGFSSPPAWVKPYAVLSNGEKFRCDLARALLGRSELVVFDEFTSLVDRTVAKIGSAAVARAVRSGQVARRFVAVSCHDDIARWLEPDWVLDMGRGTLARGRLRRPRIRLRVERARTADWRLFERHHYLSAALHRSARCFIASVNGRAAAFAAALPFPHPLRPGWREHRAVCLPDFQGVGIGNGLSEFVASLFAATGLPYFSTTSHPAMLRHRAASPLWRMHRRPGRVGTPNRSERQTCMGRRCSVRRNTAGFEYIGPARPREACAFGLIQRHLE